ncbi:hypothetical protein QQS21_004379 [Conoideocrella luteorostrata]|uniref:Peptidase S1 domain-containing protein n=1 Tax=Conoideocrella luteorostrata TaxID=1105319 RepID=A0AAJ0FUQ6_9HYPO|nr:hypothetical protein QQS21_004379 [Conoideocrella luteorostrata]
MRASISLGFSLAGSALAHPAVTRDPSDVSGIHIVGGTRATLGEFPWVVNVDGCGGALYSRQIVLTAAHCVPDTGPVNNITMTFGVVDMEDPAAVKINSTSVRNSGTTADWALVKLATPAPDSIPTLQIAKDNSYDKGLFNIVGWGDIKEGARQTQRYLLKADVPFVPDKTCQAAYPYFKPTEEICAAWPQGGVDACQNDSGGPMFRRDSGGAWIQVGIVSWGEGCARPGKPGVYVRVSAVAQMIEEAASKL